MSSFRVRNRTAIDEAALSVIETASGITDYNPTINRFFVRKTDVSGTLAVNDVYALDASDDFLRQTNIRVGGTTGGGDEITDIYRDAAGNYYVYGKGDGTGATFGLGGKANLAAGAGQTTSDLMVMKIDPAGNTLWTRFAGSTTPTADQQIYAFAVDDASGAVYVGAAISSNSIFDFAGGAGTGFGGTNYNVWIFKLDADGVQQWVRKTGGNTTFVDRPFDLVLDSAGNCYVYCLINMRNIGPAEDFAGNDITTANARPSAVFASLDPDGNQRFYRVGTSVVRDSTIGQLISTGNDLYVSYTNSGGATTVSGATEVDGATTPTATTFTVGPSVPANPDDAFRWYFITFTSGANTGESRRVVAYNGTTNEFTVSPAFSNAPNVGDTLQLQLLPSNFQDEPVTGVPLVSFLLDRYSTSGTLVWQKQFSAHALDIISDQTHTFFASGNIIFSSAFSTTSPFNVYDEGISNDTTYFYRADRTTFVISVAASTGLVNWYKAFGGFSEISSNAVDVVKSVEIVNGEVHVVAVCDTSVDGLKNSEATLVTPAASANQLVLCRLALADGALVGLEHAPDIPDARVAYDASFNRYVACVPDFSGSPLDFAGSAIALAQAGATANVCVLRLDADGVQKWIKVFGSTGADTARNATMLGSNLVVDGSVSADGVVVDANGNEVRGAAGADAYIAVFSTADGADAVHVFGGENNEGSVSKLLVAGDELTWLGTVDYSSVGVTPIDLAQDDVTNHRSANNLTLINAKLQREAMPMGLVRAVGNSKYEILTHGKATVAGAGIVAGKEVFYDEMAGALTVTPTPNRVGVGIGADEVFISIVEQVQRAA